MLRVLFAFYLGAIPHAGFAQSADQVRPALRPATVPAFGQSQAPAAATTFSVVSASDRIEIAPETQEPVPDMTTRAPGLFSSLRPPPRTLVLPRTRWQHMGGHAIWTQSTLSALKAHGKPLVDMVPADIENWCPAYPQATQAQRRAFWVGFLSALAKHESTYKPWAVGGGGRWFGLLQIFPGTARGYKCNAGTGEALKNGAANLSCAVRIMARTVPRDGVIYGRGGRGVAADWGPMRSAAKRSDMARWLRRQTYCMPISVTRPRMRP